MEGRGSRGEKSKDRARGWRPGDGISTGKSAPELGLQKPRITRAEKEREAKPSCPLWSALAAIPSHPARCPATLQLVLPAVESKSHDRGAEEETDAGARRGSRRGAGARATASASACGAAH